MEQQNPRPALDQAAYQIQVYGRLDEQWSEWFGGMVINVDQEDATSPITTLTGIVDQCGLHGILARIRDLNLRLLSVTQLDVLDGKKGEFNGKTVENGLA